jgi:cohesin complex subunit SA-1/2
MVCCVKQAATGEYPVGRGTASRRPTTKESRQVTEDKAKLTEHFIVTLPQLLARVSFNSVEVGQCFISVRVII